MQVVIVDFIVFGVEQMNFRAGEMEAGDLNLEWDEGIAFLGIAGNGDTSDREFDTQVRFDRGGDDGVIAEDLFGFIGVGGLAANADAGVAVAGKFGAAETDGVGSFADEGGKKEKSMREAIR